MIFCYRGVLESAVEREPTKVVSWVPLVGSVIPDETQLMRIRLKVALIDVRTGDWSMFAPEAFIDKTLSAALVRAQSGQAAGRAPSRSRPARPPSRPSSPSNAS